MLILVPNHQGLGLILMSNIYNIKTVYRYGPRFYDISKMYEKGFTQII